MTYGSYPVVDRYHSTYILFYALGVTTQVPVNFFTTATDFWMWKFRNLEVDDFHNASQRNELQAGFLSHYHIVASTIYAIFTVITLYLVTKISVMKRLTGSLCFVLLVFFVNMVLAGIETDSWQNGFYVVALFVGGLLTASCCSFTVSLFEAVATRFPPDYLIPLLSGQSICGIFSALVEIVCLSLKASSQTIGFIYFSAGFIMVSLVFLYLVVMLKTSAYFKLHISKEEEMKLLPKLGGSFLLSILFKVKYYVLAIFIVLGSSVIHPGLTSLITSVDKGNGHDWNELYFVPVVTFLLYNLADYLARELAAKVRRPRSGLILMWASLVRLLFVPMIMLCNAQPRSHLPVVFNKDYYYIILFLIFGFTHGYLVNSSVVQVPNGLTDDVERKLATVILLVFMVVSMAICSFLGPLLVGLL